MPKQTKTDATAAINTILDRAILMTNDHLKALKALKRCNQNISGNGVDSMLQCMARIALHEPENPLFDEALEEVMTLSVVLDHLNESMRCMMDDIYGIARHFEVFDSKTGIWLHNKEWSYDAA